MPGFTVVNLLELPDNIEFSDDLEGRFGPRRARISGTSASATGATGRATGAPGATGTAGRRRHTSCSAAPGRILLDGEVRELHQWDTARVAPEVLRAFEAGPDGLEFLAIGGPRPEEGEVALGSRLLSDVRTVAAQQGGAR